MAKKTLILSQSQINEICGWDSSYLDDLALKPDMGDVFSLETSANGSVDNGYADAETTDDKAHTMTHDWKGFAKLAGMGPITLREEGQHGNADLNNRTFGKNNDRVSYSNAKQIGYRIKKAKKQMNNGTAEEKQKAAQTLSKMRQNHDIDAIEAQYNAGKNNSAVIRNARPEGQKIASAPKQSGNGKAHSPKNGVITYLQ